MSLAEDTVGPLTKVTKKFKVVYKLMLGLTVRHTPALITATIPPLPLLPSHPRRTTVPKGVGFNFNLQIKFKATSRS